MREKWARVTARSPAAQAAAVRNLSYVTHILVSFTAISSDPSDIDILLAVVVLHA